MSEALARTTAFGADPYVALFDQSPCPMWVYEQVTGSFLAVNDAAVTLYGYSRERFLTLTLRDLYPDSDIPRITHELERLAPGAAGPRRTTRRHRTATGDLIYVDVVTTAADFAGRAAQLAVVTDITGHRSIQRQLTRMRTHDAVTGVANRTQITNRLRQAVARLAGSSGRVAVLFLDIDRFETINDGLGLDAGDAVLAQLARRLQRTVGRAGSVGRFGGDEFVVVRLLAPSAGPAAADLLARQVAVAVQRPLRQAGHEIRLSASIGVAVGQARSSPDELLQNAHTAMTQAKKNGSAVIQLFVVPERSSMPVFFRSAALRHALDAHELRLFYQPVVGLLDGRVIGAEALLRWADPDHGVIGPTEFIPLAEDNGLIVPIGEWVICEACAQLAAWHRIDPTLSVSVNVSARQLQTDGILDVLVSALSSNGIAPQQFTCEFTENVLMGDAEFFLNALAGLHASGVRLAMDDFGTGYSSLSYLKRFPLDTIKIDRSFVDGLPDDPHDSAIVGAVLSLSHSLGLSVVAEGVETSEQVVTLRKWGCRYGQGFKFGRPVPPEQFTRLVRSCA